MLLHLVHRKLSPRSSLCRSSYGVYNISIRTKSKEKIIFFIKNLEVNLNGIFFDRRLWGTFRPSEMAYFFAGVDRGMLFSIDYQNTWFNVFQMLELFSAFSCNKSYKLLSTQNIF